MLGLAKLCIRCFHFLVTPKICLNLFPREVGKLRKLFFRVDYPDPASTAPCRFVVI